MVWGICPGLRGLNLRMFKVKGLRLSTFGLDRSPDSKVPKPIRGLE